MNEFDYERIQRTNLARQAKYRKRGSKSKKCPLSTDHMTMKQWKERNGTVVSINMGLAIRDFKAFKEYPEDLQREYLQMLVSRFHANMSNIAEMFGVVPNTLKAQMQAIGFRAEFHRGVRMSAAERADWLCFLGEAPISDPPEDKPDCIPDAPSPALDDLVLRPVPTPIVAAPPDPMRMQSFELVFKGPVDLSAVCNSLRAMYVEGADATIIVKCDFAG